MGYPATTQYLARKLNWMARQLKEKNEPSSIIEWTEAMQSVVKLVEVCSGVDQLSTPIQYRLYGRKGLAIDCVPKSR